jgi:hypothetical protein
VAVTLPFETAGKTAPDFSRRLTPLKFLHLLGQAGLFWRYAHQIFPSMAQPN